MDISMSINLLAELARDEVADASKMETSQKKPQPAKTDETGIPYEPCLVCRDSFYVKRQEPGASWYCWTCLGKGGDDPLTYRDAAGNVRYLETCSFGDDWPPLEGELLPQESDLHRQVSRHLVRSGEILENLKNRSNNRGGG